MNKNFWAGKTIFLTGHTGFKGSWLSIWLKLLGSDLVGYSLGPPTQPSLFDLTSLKDEMTSIIGDIRDLKRLQSLIYSVQPEIVIHMAAQSLVLPSYENPIETYSTNLMGTINVLESVRNCKSVKAVLIVTSDKCYKNREWVWGYREDDPMGGNDPYSCSKGCSELITDSYRKSFFNPDEYARHAVGLASARAGNVIGGGDWARDRLIPDIMASFINNQTLRIRFLNAVRPWQHVLEPLAGYLCLIEKLYHEGQSYSTAWNFGPSETDIRSVRWIVNRVSSLWGKDARFEIDNNSPSPEAGILKLDSSKARTLLRWVPKLNLDQALEWTVDWYKAYNQNIDTSIRLIEEQIISYQLLGS